MNYLDIDKTFFGRQSCLDLLSRRVRDLKEGYRQNLALLGNRYLGKSSILYHFLKNIDDKDVTVIYLDLENKDFNYLVNKFVASLLYNYVRNLDLPIHTDIPFLLESTKNVLPHTVSVIRKVLSDYNSGKLNAAFEGLLAL